MAKTIDSFNFNSLELENSWDVTLLSDNERARIILLFPNHQSRWQL